MVMIIKGLLSSKDELHIWHFSWKVIKVVLVFSPLYDSGCDRCEETTPLLVFLSLSSIYLFHSPRCFDVFASLPRPAP